MRRITVAVVLVATLPAFSATISIDTYPLRENTPGQPIEIRVAPGDPPELIAGMNLIAEILDGPTFDPAPLDVETGTIWIGDPIVLDSEVVLGGRIALGGVLVQDPVFADGLLGTLLVDTTGYFAGEGPWNLLLADTVGGSTELLDRYGRQIDVTVPVGSIALVKEPAARMLLVIAAGFAIGVFVARRWGTPKINRLRAERDRLRAKRDEWTRKHPEGARRL